MCAGVSKQLLLYFSTVLFLTGSWEGKEGGHYHPKDACKRPKMAVYAVPKPVKFWKSLKTKLAGCLWLFVARMTTMTTMKDRMFQTRMPRDILSNRCGP